MTQEVKPETENRQPEPTPDNFKPYFPCEQECPTCHTKWTADQPLPCPTCTNLLQENAQLRAQVEEWQTAAHQLYKNAASSLLPVPNELEKAVQRWVEAKRAEVLREDTKGDLQLEVRKQEQDVEAAIYEELENELDRKRG